MGMKPDRGHGHQKMGGGIPLRGYKHQKMGGGNEIEEGGGENWVEMRKCEKT